MRDSLGEGPTAEITQPNPTLNIRINMPPERTPREVAEWLTKLGWRSQYSHIDDCEFYSKEGSGGGYFKWYEAVAYEMFNFMVLGNIKDPIPK